MRVPLGIVVLVWSSLAVALDIQGRIQWNEHCPGLGDLGQAKVVLDQGVAQGGVRRDGGFTIPSVAPGTYVLSVVSHDHVFDKLRVDVHETDSLPEIRPYIPGTPLSPASPVTLPYPVVLSASRKLDFYTAHEQFDIVAMFKNPMMMMMLVGGVMVFAMPYIMKNMDPEVLQDFEKRQARITDIQSSLQSGDIRSGLSALMAATEEDAGGATSEKPAQDAKASPSGVKHRGGKNKRR